MSSSVVLRFDASAKIGGGHAIRCMALADALLQRGWRCLLACRAETFSVVPLPPDHRYQILEMDCRPQDEPRLLHQMWSSGTDALIVDHYSRGPDFERSCRDWARHIVAVDGQLRDHDSELLVDPNPGRDESTYTGLVSAGCRILTGCSYAMLRPAFAEKRTWSLARRRRGGLNSILVQFGAGDSHGLMGVVLTGVERSGFEGTVHLAGKIQELAVVNELRQKTFPFEVVCHDWIEDVAQLLSQIDLMIGAGGSSVWESCCLGVPSLLVKLAENQSYPIEQVCRYGAAAYLGEWKALAANDVAAAISQCLSAPEYLVQLSRKSADLCDGRGAMRVAEAIEELAGVALGAVSVQ